MTDREIPEDGDEPDHLFPAGIALVGAFAMFLIGWAWAGMLYVALAVFLAAVYGDDPGEIDQHPDQQP